MGRVIHRWDARKLPPILASGAFEGIFHHADIVIIMCFPVDEFSESSLFILLTAENCRRPIEAGFPHGIGQSCFADKPFDLNDFVDINGAGNSTVHMFSCFQRFNDHLSMGKALCEDAHRIDPI